LGQLIGVGVTGITEPDCAAGVCSIDGATAYLEQQSWWPAFRDDRVPRVPQIDDVLWTGHFCAWLRSQGMTIEQCTRTELSDYLKSVDSFRPGPRSACRRTVTDLVEWLNRRAESESDPARENRVGF
jgi:hypothetical protein